MVSKRSIACELRTRRGAIHNNNHEGSSCIMKAEPELSSSNFGEASVSKRQRRCKQCLLAIVLNACLNISSTHAQERREFVPYPLASSQVAEPSKSDTDCVYPQVLLFPATLGGATASPMNLVDVARSTCSSSIAAPQRESGVRRSPSSHALTDARQPLTDPAAAFSDTNASDITAVRRRRSLGPRSLVSSRNLSILYHLKASSMGLNLADASMIALAIAMPWQQRQAGRRTRRSQA